MFAYVAEKYDISNGPQLRSMAWNPDEGWILCGGDSGLLKILKLESESLHSITGVDKSVTGFTTYETHQPIMEPVLALNQTLEGHKDAITCLAWNTKFVKFASSDKNGLIIVWTLESGVWREEMINNRNKSIVSDMQWTNDGSRICIIYQDGTVIVGSVDGNRLWGKQLDVDLKLFAWSPSGKQILFVTTCNRIDVYDDSGNNVICSTESINYMGKTPKCNVDGDILSNQDSMKTAIDLNIIAIDWFDRNGGCYDHDGPSLAIAFESGLCKLYEGVNDINPIILNTNLTISSCKWCPNGRFIALSGFSNDKDQINEVSMACIVKFFNTSGAEIHFLSFPIDEGGTTYITAMSWEGNGLRLGVTIGSMLYLSNIKRYNLWGYFEDTIIYAFIKPECHDVRVMFWNIQTGERHKKYVKNVKFIKTTSQSCLIIEKVNESVSIRNKFVYVFTIYDSVGYPVASHKDWNEPIVVTMNQNYVVSSDGSTVGLWCHNPSNANGANTQIDDNIQSLNLSNVTCIDISEFVLFVGLSSGYIHVYALTPLKQLEVIQINVHPRQIYLNCDGTKISVIDNTNHLFIYEKNFDLKNEMDSNEKSKNRLLLFETHDVWDIKWSEENSSSFAVMKNENLIVFNELGKDMEAPIPSKGYLFEFKNMKVGTILLDEIMVSPEMPTKGKILQFETKQLKNTRELIIKKGLEEAFENFSDASKPILDIIIRTAIDKFNFHLAERAFVKCDDYNGIKFLDDLKLHEDPMRQRAEILCFYQQFDEAELAYREMDRLDLAIELRIRQGKWFRAVQLIQGGGKDVESLQDAWYHIGEYYEERFNWSNAASYYLKSKAFEKAFECFQRADDYEQIEKISEIIPENTTTLIEFGKKFEAIGMCKQAVACFIKADKIELAVAACIKLYEWEYVTSISKKYGFIKLKEIIFREANALIDSGDKIKAVKMFREAKLSNNAAQLLSDIGEDIAKQKSDFRLSKKLHILAALEVERYRKNNLSLSGITTKDGMNIQQTETSLKALMNNETEIIGGFRSKQILDNAWRGASGCHYFLLAQEQLNAGNIDAAMKTSMRCVEFEDILGVEKIFSLVAITSFHNKYYGICSRAFIKLETLTNQNEVRVDEIQTLACQIFTQHPPNDPTMIPLCYANCLETAKPYHACVITGHSIINKRVLQCQCCHHYMIEDELGSTRYCPLCHTEIDIDNAIITIIEENEE